MANVCLLDSSHPCILPCMSGTRFEDDREGGSRRWVLEDPRGADGEVTSLACIGLTRSNHQRTWTSNWNWNWFYPIIFNPMNTKKYHLHSFAQVFHRSLQHTWCFWRPIFNWSFVWPSAGSIWDSFQLDCIWKPTKKEVRYFPKHRSIYSYMDPISIGDTIDSDDIVSQSLSHLISPPHQSKYIDLSYSTRMIGCDRLSGLMHIYVHYPPGWRLLGSMLARQSLRCWRRSTLLKVSTWRLGGNECSQPVPSHFKVWKKPIMFFMHD